MNIVAFHGSPRLGGNSDLLLQEVLRTIDTDVHAVRVFRLNLISLRPCQNCGGCDETGVCVIEDDMRAIYNAIRTADMVILTSPIFFFGLSAQTKTMIDRCQCLWCEKYLLKKPISEGIHGRKGLLLLVGGMKKELGIQCGEATAKAFFRTISVTEHETMSFLGVDQKGAILNHQTALYDAHIAGERLINSDKELLER